MNTDRAIVMACILAVPLVLLCEPARAFDPGWKKVREPAYFVTVMEVADAKAYCAPESRKAVLGCYQAAFGLIFLQAGMSATDRACILRHEQEGHAAGCDHGPESTLTARPDCGPERCE
jgi:hypothetical protein